MPEWLKLLLAAQGSLGLADTLHTLLGVVPQYQQVPNQRGANTDLMAVAGFNQQRQPVMGITPKLAQQYGRMSKTGARNRGDQFLTHEFGHLLTGPASKNEALSSLLVAIDPEAINTESGNEAFADDFQLAIEALRSGKKSKVKPRVRQIMDVLVQFQPFQTTTAQR